MDRVISNFNGEVGGECFDSMDTGTSGLIGDVDGLNNVKSGFHKMLMACAMSEDHHPISCGSICIIR